MTTAIIHDQNLEKHIEKQMGCIAGFFQLFDRHQILSRKKLYATTKRLPPTPAVNSTPVSEISIGSPAVSRDLECPSPDRLKASPKTEIRSPAHNEVTPAEMPAKMPLPFPVFQLREGNRSSWKFCKEAPRLSLDSRATVDAKGSLYPREIRTNTAILSANRGGDNRNGAAADGDDNRRSPSVIAKLMGLEQLPHSSPETMKPAGLRRSASESRVSKDLFHSRFVDAKNNFQQKHPNQPHSVGGGNLSNNAVRDIAAARNTASSNFKPADRTEYSRRNADSEPLKPSYRGGAAGSPWKSPQQRKNFFDSEDFFPEPKQTISIYGEIEKRLRMRGINEPSRDLETLKHILDALQLKGLLHSQKPSEQAMSQRNIVYERTFSSLESPIVVMKPVRPPASPVNGRFGNRAGVRLNPSNAGESCHSVNRLRERPNQVRGGNSSSPTRRDHSPTRRDQINAKSPNSPAKRKPLSVETQWKKTNESEQRRPSPVQSPKLNAKKNGSPRNRVLTAAVEEESSSISESSVSTSSQIDTERSAMEEHEEGKTLLERCGKLLHSITEMTATELQPSPVSVLDSSFYKDESSSPSPVMKRSITFEVPDRGGESEEEVWSPAISTIQSNCFAKTDGDYDFIYISDVLRASKYLPEDADVFSLLEKQQYLIGKDTSKASSLQRKLIFDTISEILDRNSELPPWKVVSWSNSSLPKPPLQAIWTEFQRIRERDAAEDLFDIICGVLRKDLAGDAISGWRDCHVEMSEAVLDIERLIFKDLVGETIRDLVAFAGHSTGSAPGRMPAF